MTLSCIWSRGSSSTALEYMEYPFIAITPKSTLIQSCSNNYGANYGGNRTI